MMPDIMLLIDARTQCNEDSSNRLRKVRFTLTNFDSSHVLRPGSSPKYS